MKKTIVFITILLVTLLFAKVSLASGTPNPTLSGMADNTAKDLGSYTCVTQPGDQPCQGIIGYSKFIYDKNNYQILMFGGGHAEAFRDDVDVFSFDSLTWSPAYPPTPCADMTLANLDTTNGIWRTTGHPVSRHTYDMLVMTDNEMVVLDGIGGVGGCAERPSGGGSDPYFSTGKINHYNPVTKTWRRSAASVGSWYYAAAAEYDPISKKAIIIGQTNQASGTGLWVYDPIAETATSNLWQWSNIPYDLSYAKNLVYFPPNQKMYYMMNDGTVYEIALNRTNLANTALTQVTGISGTRPNTGETGYAYDSVNQIIGGAVSNNVFYAYNPITKVWTAKTIQVQSSRVSSVGDLDDSAAHTIDYDPVNNVFVFISGSVDLGATRTWAYRYAGGGTSPPSDTAPPTVSMTAPASGSMVSGSSVTVSANASDNVGVTGVQFKLDGTNLGSEDTTSPYSIIWNTTQTTNGSHALTATARDAAGNQTTSGAVTVTVSNATPPTGGSDFQARCSQPGVVRCYGFDDPNDKTTTLSDQAKTLKFIGASDGGPNRFTWDNTIKASGANSLRVDSPAQANADCCGSVSMNFANDYSIQFGAGETFYIQERQRYSSSFLGRWFQTGGGGTGSKLVWVGEGDQPGITAYSCTEMESVLTTDTSHPILGGQYGWPTFYHGCGRFVSLDWYDGVQVRLQHQGPPYCYYPNDPQKGCFPLYANEWMTFKYKIQIGTWNTPSSRVQVWAAREGQPSVMIFDSNDAFAPTQGNPGGMTLYNMVDCSYTGGVQPCSGGSGTYPNAKFGKIWFSPYMTSRAFDQTSVGGTNRPFSIWYDELIVSREDIADPTTTTKGDVNKDSSIDVLDVQSLVNHILGIQDYGISADVNSDSSVDVLDVQEVVNIILG